MTEMMAVQKARKIEEMQRPLGATIASFWKRSKPEIVNIFFAFVCVLLAYQIHGMRAGIRKLLAQREERDAEIDSLRGILAGLSSSEGNATADAGGEADGGDDGDDGSSFSAGLARNCAMVVRRIFEDSERKAGYSWILGKRLASGDALEMEKLEDELRPVILSGIRSVVGDAAYTPEELKERRVAELNVEKEVVVAGGGSDGAAGDRTNAQIGDLMEILEEVHSQDLTDGQNSTSGESGDGASTKVRRTRYAI